MTKQEKVVCIISGGLDSICFAAALAKTGSRLFTLAFDYDQRAQVELSRARYFAKLVGSEDHKVLDISFMKELYGSSNALTDRRLSLRSSFRRDLVVPIRNAIFLTIATAWAMSIGAKKVAYGAHLDDVLNYPDCRPVFAHKLEDALNLADIDNITAGDRNRVSILSPAIKNLSKSELLRSGYQLFGERLFRTWSCYSGGVKRGGKLLHCGRCESCINRKSAFRDAQIQDKTGYASRWPLN